MVIRGGMDEGGGVDEEDDSGWAITGAMWNRADMLWVWAKRLSWWAMTEAGVRGASA